METSTESLVNSGGLLYPEAISELAARTDALFYFILWASGIILLGLILVTAYFFIVNALGKQKKIPHVTDHFGFEFAWTAIPIVLVFIVFYWGYKDFIELRVPPEDAIVVQVQGWKWAWGFEYPNGVTSMGEFVVPVDTPVKLVMSSKDVIHSFYLPNLRTKRDVMPNRYSTLWFKAEKTGNFQVFCTEYCGDSHSTMLATLRVVSREKYDNWLANGGSDRELPLDQLGENVYKKASCFSCHSLDGSAVIGPSWKGIYGETQNFTDGTTATVDENYLRESIVNPQKKIVEGYAPVMPSYSGLLSDREITGIIEYIKTLK